MRPHRLFRWSIALALLLGTLWLPAAPSRADDPAPAEAAGASSRVPPFVYGVRQDGRPVRALPTDRKRADAVAAGLQWLAAHQHPSGIWLAADLSWCGGTARGTKPDGAGKSLYDVGVSGLAISAFLAAGHTHNDGGPLAETLAKGLLALTERQDEEGCFGARSSQHFLYGHAFACLAVVEAYGVTGDERLRPFAAKGLAFGVRAQNPEAGWRYGVRPGDSDVSATGCMIMAFAAAHWLGEAAIAAGREPPLPFPHTVWVGARAVVDRFTDAAYGRTGYIQTGGAAARPQEVIDRFPADLSESCTAIGHLVRQVVPSTDDEADTELTEKATALLHARPPRWSPGTGHIDLYYWYYGCLALLRQGPEAWGPWEGAVSKALLASQRDDGDPCSYRGSWDPAGPWGPDGGRIYSTAMCVLMLQAPYRFPAHPGDRSDLRLALERRDRSATERVELLDAIAIYRVPNAASRITSFLKAESAPERAAAARALAACTPDAKAVKALGRVLEADDAVEVRRAAARGLRQLGGEARPALAGLEAALSDEDLDVRIAALGALGGIGRSAAGTTPSARALLTHESVGLRVAAAGALFAIEGATPDAEQVLLAGLTARAPRVRRAAAAHLAASLPCSAPVHAALTRALRDASPAVRVQAALGVRHGEHAVAAMVDVLRAGFAAPELETRRASLALATALGEAAGPITARVVPMALEGPPAVRVEALHTLAALGVEAPGAVAVLHACRVDRAPQVRDAADAACRTHAKRRGAVVSALAAALTHTDPRIRDGAVRGLVECGAEAVAPLRALLPDAPERLQPHVLLALGEIGSVARAALPDVLALIDSAEAFPVLRAAATTIGRIGATGTDAVRALTSLLEVQDYRTRAAALTSLGHMGLDEPAAVEALGVLAADRNPQRRARRLAALQALAEVGPGAELVLPTLVNTLGEEDPRLREAAVEALAAIGEPALAVLRRSLKEPSVPVQRSALEAIGKMGPAAQRAIPDLIAMLEESRTDSIYRIADALAGIGKKSVRPLTKLLRDKNAFVRTGAAYGLGRIGPEAKSALSALRRLLRDRESRVAEQAKEAIDRIKTR